MEEKPIEGRRRKKLEDAAGYAGCKIMRRVLGLAYVWDLESLEDPSLREKTAFDVSDYGFYYGKRGYSPSSGRLNFLSRRTRKTEYESLICTTPDFPKEGIQFKDMTTLLKNGEAFREVMNEISASVRHLGIDLIVSPEAWVYPWPPLAYTLGVGFVPVRLQMIYSLQGEPWQRS